jgi:hypothetical protein
MVRFYSIRENKTGRRQRLLDLTLPRAAGSQRGIEGSAKMVERKSELKRRYQRKKKLTKLKRKLAATKEPRDKDAIVRKIHIISPWWEVPAEA